ncbi:hypothetical protein FT663_02382 [Candidozyma haemuli var. vulneris]|uniref:DNA replication complex GINS protein SLD5 n=1 Tax=Candidozyma haemuli TaxID=45357 RepID=A0A2V1B068_9ASCO|nr:hypothetical protein CXQ85_002895 [[Candida] haemuloni]KAF3988348.1 hypothetical protein FT662_03463 [[Candida] haemuloni var. vulneris]KAF3992192.1 hypothetical protein FT663_02382 [[Candida] haemuloni var. vulneris]PVH23166.1 hypothetical protein CXQ85_002895 [[Candida] haemuloni]
MEIDDILKDFESSAHPQPKLQSNTIEQELIQAMINERMAPELLPYKHDVMEIVLSRIQSQQQLLLDSHEYGDSNAEAGVVSSDFKLRLMIVETDIERISYIVRLYIRTRLSKIEKFTIYYINETAEELDSSRSRLSAQERSYMQKFFQILTQLYNNSFLRKLPSELALLDGDQDITPMVTEPDLDLPVFVKVETSSPILISLGDDDSLELEKDGVYVVKYRLIRRYLQIGDVVLI